MLSEGRPGVDDRYSLKDGKVTIKSGHSGISCMKRC